MVNGKKVVITIWAFLVVIALIHTSLHIVIYGVNIPGVGKASLSGLSIGGLKLGQDIKLNMGIFNSSKIILIAEWVLIGAIFLYVFLRSLTRKKEEVKELRTQKEVHRTGMETELDHLHNILKERKRLSLSTIVKLFGVDKDTATDWIKTLEAANLAMVHYPRFGEPEVILKEQPKKEVNHEEIS
jgi:Trk-type K+ transport system membrane component